MFPRDLCGVEEYCGCDRGHGRTTAKYQTHRNSGVLHTQLCTEQYTAHSTLPVLHTRVYTVLHTQLYTVLYTQLCTVMHTQLYTVLQNQLYNVLHTQFCTLLHTLYCLYHNLALSKTSFTIFFKHPKKPPKSDIFTD